MEGIYFITEEEELTDEGMSKNLDNVEKTLLYLFEVMKGEEGKRSVNLSKVFNGLLELGKAAKEIDPKLRRIFYSLYYLLLNAEMYAEGGFIYETDKYLVELVKECSATDFEETSEEKGLNIFDEKTGKRLLMEDLE